MKMYARKVDANQAEIVAALRKIGAWVIDLSASGNGVPDLHVVRGGVAAWVEIKDGSKPPSKRELTPEQKDWHAQAALHGLPVFVVTSVGEALAIFGARAAA